MTLRDAVLVVGEIVVDFTLAQCGADCKLRLGGIVHAARGLWAAELEYAVAAFCPRYLVAEAHNYLLAHGCKDFIWLGDITGSPNVIVIGDATEVSHQGYEDLLRDRKKIELRQPFPDAANYTNVIVFPGKFDIECLREWLPPDANITFDIAYDVEDLSSLKGFRGRTRAIIISTSSWLFLNVAKDSVDDLIATVRTLAADALLLKENRGGSRLFDLRGDNVEEIPAVLGQTVNSVGVGDVYSAVMIGFSKGGWAEAAWRGSQAATAYSQTTYPDDLKRDLQRAFKLSIAELRALAGTFLPWHDRQQFSIYMAGPDFSYVKKPEFERAADSLGYHNFKVWRPIKENGELSRPASRLDLLQTYRKDFDLLKECDAVFAVPLDRDPGTLVEIGMAIALEKPVITFDPRNENNNTMVVAGSNVYSDNLDQCLNGTFNVLAKLRAEAK